VTMSGYRLIPIRLNSYSQGKVNSRASLNHIFGVTLRRSTSVNYLGVILDSRLNWRQHVDVKTKAHDLLSFMKLKHRADRRNMLVFALIARRL